MANILVVDDEHGIRDLLSEILNVSRTSMSRELGRLQDEGILQMDGRQVTLLKPDEVTEYGF